MPQPASNPSASAPAAARAAAAVRPRRRRHVVTTLAILMASPMITIAVAWTCHARAYGRLESLGVPGDQTAVWRQVRAEAPDLARYQHRSATLARVGRATGFEHQQFRVRGWDEPASGVFTHSGPGTQVEVSHVRAGWPLACVSAMRIDIVEGARMTTGPATTRIEVGLVSLDTMVPGWIQSGLGASGRLAMKRTVPVTIDPPRMLANVAVVAAVLTALLCGPGVLRRFMRRRRGACIGCGHARPTNPRGGSPCPECGLGAAVPAHA